MRDIHYQIEVLKDWKKTSHRPQPLTTTIYSEDGTKSRTFKHK